VYDQAMLLLNLKEFVVPGSLGGAFIVFQLFYSHAAQWEGLSQCPTNSFHIKPAYITDLKPKLRPSLLFPIT